MENIKECPENVVEVRYVIVRIESPFSTVIAFRARIRAADFFLALAIKKYVTSFDIDAALFKHTHEKVEATDSEDQEEEE